MGGYRLLGISGHDQCIVAGCADMLEVHRSLVYLCECSCHVSVGVLNTLSCDFLPLACKVVSQCGCFSEARMRQVYHELV